MVPIGDFGAESIGDIRVDLGCGLVLRVVGLLIGSDLGEYPIGLFDEVAVDGVGIGGAEVEANVAAQDEDGDEAAEDGDLDVIEGAVDLTAARDSRGGGSAAVRGGGGKCSALLWCPGIVTHLCPNTRPLSLCLSHTHTHYIFQSGSGLEREDA